ncbi:endoglucanase [Clostridium acetobutylicum]|uniref:Endoglucanase, aminopeptidase M42 family n=1 Tax=Clostridium acetobutylicum (strain ATCC 824 / DSM 792 / JCM 1419 / IAM 19013 / LMG 5710 / NBRC 13948 / NRRL B-527 / VKM B-1787 / 2291 / W) TaxID=272562 RepID=Q97MI1_CLOAB|nr:MULTISPECIES: M42 family metallopeptidase [Clostridium]AAK78198.1 Endoglucanase, aminopeptidase M42 family [Clostridium acetobutylicum ATCC 824]ADZ19262.1 Endoglucanase, aminopeptidase M42 family [Clostridium acetobutylicum EA 2018]AEI34031.1 aminopeptidase M42 family endoglucanase [Clostridium acetobutylicum DSM 1731]AWV82005.1 M42 family peptidase [Clostridium acetobutylicum]MBC2395926.1 M42 family metallopeptidase [Clostridium acetobutylicum]
MDMLLKKILGTFGVSGREKEISEVIKEELNKYPCEVREDKLGNIIVKLGSGREKIMLSTNMDKKGVITYHIEEDGKVRIDAIGDIKADDIIGKTVVFRSGIEGKIESEKKENNEFRDIYVNVNMGKREAVLKYISEGEAAEFGGNTFADKENVVGPYLSNRAGCYAFLKVIKEIKSIDKEVYFVFSTQGNLNGRGARAAAFEIEPDMCISVNTEKEGEVKLSEGPILVLMEKGLITNYHVKEQIISSAEKAQIKLQRCVSSESSDGSVVHKEVGGIKTGTIALPCKNKNETNETISLNDVDDLVKLLQYIVKK